MSNEYTPRQHTVYAIQWNGWVGRTEEIQSFLGGEDHAATSLTRGGLSVHTLKWSVTVPKNGWIIRHKAGPLRYEMLTDDLFKHRYETATKAAPSDATHH
jgi:hypothetical protein